MTGCAPNCATPTFRQVTIISPLTQPVHSQLTSPGIADTQAPARRTKPWPNGHIRSSTTAKATPPLDAARAGDLGAVWLTTVPIPDCGKASFVDSNEFVAEARIHELGRARDRAEIARQQAEAAARRAQALRLAADAELALRSPQVPTTVALALGAESVLTEPTPRGHRALRQVLSRHSRTQSRHNHGGLVFAVAFAPDGTRVATACGDGSARVFDAATGTALGRLDHDKRVVAVAFSPDGKCVATGSDDGSARGV